MNKTAVVVNPASHNGALGRRWPEIARLLEREIGAFDASITARPRDATRLARAALAGGADRVIAVGGDGTTHEVVNGFFDERGDAVKPDAVLGILPFGTGGDFRKTAGIPGDLHAAAHALAARHTRRIDLGRLEFQDGDGQAGRCVFINIASFGMGGVVDHIVNSSSKLLGGKASFLLATLRASIRYKNQRVRMVFDGKKDEPLEISVVNVAVANGRYFGGGMFIAPDAQLDDGAFDVVAIRDLGTLQAALKVPRLYNGTHVTMPEVSVRRATRVEALPVVDGAEVLLDVDGEQPGRLPATFSIMPGALSLIVPEHG